MNLPDGEIINRNVFTIKNNKSITKIFAFGDTHIPFHFKPALDIAIKECIKYKPDVILLFGDIMDFYSISSYMKRPDRVFLKKEVDTGIEFFEYLRSKFPNTPIVYRTGNHEERLAKFIYNVPQLFGIVELDELLHLTENKITLVDNKRIIKCGNVNFIHGDEKKGSGKNIARVMSNKFPEQSIIYGHYHRPDEYLITDKFNNYYWSICVGCLSELSPQFCPYNEWLHGFIKVEVDSKGKFVFENKRVIGGIIH